ncbi:MAG: hypothetical protein R2789_03865 [Microthrixaceae bacterium]
MNASEIPITITSLRSVSCGAPTDRRRPQKVEELLHRQGPQQPQQAHARGEEGRQDEVGVGDRAHHLEPPVGQEVTNLRRSEQLDGHHEHGEDADHQVHGGEEPQHPAHVEAAQGYVAGLLALVEQQVGDQESAEHEEEIDEDRRPGQERRHLGVEEHHLEHEDPAHAVEVRHVAQLGTIDVDQPTLCGRARGGLHGH